MNLMSTDLAPRLDSLGRWYWPDPDCECVRYASLAVFEWFLPTFG